MKKYILTVLFAGLIIFVTTYRSETYWGSGQIGLQNSERSGERKMPLQQNKLLFTMPGNFTTETLLTCKARKDTISANSCSRVMVNPSDKFRKTSSALKKYNPGAWIL